MSCCDLQLWPVDVELLYHFGCHALKFCTKFEWNGVIDHWVIDSLAGFRHAILGVGHFCPTVLRVAWTQLHQTWRQHRAIIPTEEICFSVQISCCIFKHERLRGDWCWKQCQISHFLTTSENYGRGGRDLYISCWGFTYDWLCEIHLMAIHCTAAKHGALIKKWKKKFMNNVGWPNYFKELVWCHACDSCASSDSGHDYLFNASKSGPKTGSG